LTYAANFNPETSRVHWFVETWRETFLTTETSPGHHDNSQTQLFLAEKMLSTGFAWEPHDGRNGIQFRRTYCAGGNRI